MIVSWSMKLSGSAKSSRRYALKIILARRVTHSARDSCSESFGLAIGCGEEGSSIGVHLVRSVVPACLVQPRGWIAPRSVVALLAVALEPVHQRAEVDLPLHRALERALGLGLADLVRVAHPEHVEVIVVHVDA